MTLVAMMIMSRYERGEGGEGQHRIVQLGEEEERHGPSVLRGQRGKKKGIRKAPLLRIRDEGASPISGEHGTILLLCFRTCSIRISEHVRLRSQV